MTTQINERIVQLLKNFFKNLKELKYTVPHSHTMIIKIFHRPHNGLEIKSHKTGVSKRRDARHRKAGSKAEMLFCSPIATDLRKIKEFRYILKMNGTRKYVSSDVTSNRVLPSLKKREARIKSIRNRTII